MSQPAKAQEPSMEEILASIRRIIADDEKPAEVKAEPKAASPPASVAAPVAEPPRARAPEPARTAPPPMPKPVVAEPAAQMDAMLADVGEASASSEDVLDLTEDMTRPAPAPAFRTVEARDDIEFAEAASAAAATEPQPAAPETRPLMSATTMAAVDSAFNSLAHTVLAGNARTLEDLVREMLRPLLKSWIDDNLPGLVERIVRAEIERVSRGR